jgi:hypothetical protein
MPKKLRRDPVFLADQITAFVNENGSAVVLDLKTQINLDISNTIHNVKIFQRQVENWFLKPASNFSKGNKNKFVVLMICLSYFEGIEQLKTGQSSDWRSKDFFVRSVNRLYTFHTRVQIESLYEQGRCGLFHNGMTRELILLDETSLSPIVFEGSDAIRINPKLLLRDVKRDFKDYIDLLLNDFDARTKFSVMYSF